MIYVSNGEFLNAPTAEMLPLPAGRGVFETLRWDDGALPFFADHWRRCAKGCAWYGLTLPVAQEAVEELAGVLAKKNGLRHGVLRLAVWAADRGVAWRLEVSAPRPHMTRRDCRVTRGSEIPAGGATERIYKHLGREHWLEALRRARAEGWDEALLFDAAGRLVESCVSNVFLVVDDVLLTPSLACGPLPGVMRERVLVQARVLRLAVREGEWGERELRCASELWLTNALIGIRPVTEFAGGTFASDPPLLARLRAGWQAEYGWDPVVVSPRA